MVDGARRIRVLVTGASGYVGGQLVAQLLDRGHLVSCMVRNARQGQREEWSGRVQIVEADVLRPSTLRSALRGIEVAYYLVHSMAAGSGFSERDRQAAKSFSSAAARAGVKQIIYLGGLGDPDSDLSPHLRSRHETGAALRLDGVPVTEFRAGVIVGSGSISFETVRYLTERVPVMICPRWVFTKTQPIAIRDVLRYLVEALRPDDPIEGLVEIGANVLSYGQMMKVYAQVRGLRRFLLPVPVLTPRLSSYWVHLVTPVPAAIARPLIDGLRNEAICRDSAAQNLFPDIRPISYKEAVTKALSCLDRDPPKATWNDAVGTRSSFIQRTVLDREGVISERRTLSTRVSQIELYRVICGLGGKRGWPYMNWAWSLRGIIDRLLGGVGRRRRRRDPDQLRPGDVLDFWRVEQALEPQVVRVRAELKIPGQAWLEFRLRTERGRTWLEQTAYFVPLGFLGWIYWCALYPVHAEMFTGMIRCIIQQAEVRTEVALQRRIS